MEIKLNRTVIHKTIFLVLHIIICYSVFAQNEGVSKLKSYDIIAPQKLFLPPFSTDLQLYHSNNPVFKNYFSHINKMSFRITEINTQTRISFNQNKIENDFPGLGSYDFYNNTLDYRINYNTKIDIGVGLARQNSILYGAKPNYQIGFQASVEFAVTSKLDAFIYGQYFTSPINKSKDFFDPIIDRIIVSAKRSWCWFKKKL